MATLFNHRDHKVFTLRSQRDLRGLCVSSSVYFVVPLMLNKVQNAQVSDTTKADSS